MRYEIHGTVMQTLDVFLAPGESMYTESGGMAWMKGNIEMKTDTKGGLMAGLGRKLAGESLFMTNYVNHGPDEALIVFTPEAPGKIIPVKLGAGQSIICQRDAFMCAEASVDGYPCTPASGSAQELFGGEGFVRRRSQGRALPSSSCPARCASTRWQPARR